MDPQDRSLNGNGFLPQWMKGRANRRCDLDESSFSPPSHDDSFLCIRYARQSSSSGKQAFQNVEQVIQDNKTTVVAQVAPTNNDSDLKKRKDIDFTKHHPACRPYISNDPQSSQNLVSGHINAKSTLSSDDFDERTSLCGKSIVHVAQQIMSNSLVKPGISESRPEPVVEASLKKGSRSLPATPFASPANTPDSSPKARRRHNTNRYFTPPFVQDPEKYHGSWIIANLLGRSREVVTHKIDEEDERQTESPQPRTMHRKKSISSQNLTYIDKEQKPDVVKNFAEYREMNCWSPTST